MVTPLSVFSLTILEELEEELPLMSCKSNKELKQLIHFLLGAGQVNEEEHVLPAEAGITTNKTQHCLYYRNEVLRLKRWICLI